MLLSLINKAISTNDIEDIERVHKGYSNKVWKLITKSGGKYKIRIGDNNALISRKNELAILKLINNKDCLFYEEENGNSIWKWIEGTTTSKSDINKQYLNSLVDLVNNIHNTPVSSKVLHHDDMEFYEISKKYFNEEDLNLYKRLVEKYKNDARVLCHNDVSLGNLIYDSENKKLHLIDYEWGRINSRYWDYGNFIKESDLPLKQIKYLSKIADLNLIKLLQYCYLATIYSLQLTYVLNLSEAIKAYRKKLIEQLNKYRALLTY
ncbi:choline kinase [Candidatus Mycoplasma haematobovis]|uniref:Choline kinase n=1 Tax=Candidatus Mycoplasma haematobovis TaxID=432608 RepID=A0A1A9QCM2_9MOLU|nr:phosphotransferase [Candidatus Mycoplasma haematobovis]OAL10217.1 choline kinase [Candidatus Mycoplasma haematobovis]